MTGIIRATLGVTFVLVLGCEARLSVVGSACSRSGECAAPLVCLLGRCRSECVSQRDCALGARCVLGAGGAGSCALPDDPRCPETPCASSLLCVSSGACVNACDTVASCPAGSVCVLDESRRGYCERDDVDAGPGPDAGPADASDPLDAPDASELPDAGCAGPGCDPVVSIALTTVSSCARTEGGAVYCWGFGDHIARPGLPTCPSSGTACTGTPVRARIDDGGSTGDLSATWLAGAEANYAAVVGSRAFAWGAGYTNALGTLPSGEVARAVRLEPGTSFLPTAVGGVRLGSAFGIAVGSEGTWMWGNEDRAQRGEGVGPGTTYAEPADPLPGATDVVLGDAHGCGITAAGAIECWGANGNGQIDSGTAGAGSNVDAHTPIAGVPTPIDDVALGRSHTCALVLGEIWCWGNRNAMGRAVESVACTTGVDRMACPPAVVTRSGPEFAALGATISSNTTCAIDSNSDLWCWGEDLAVEPTRVVGLPAIAAVATSRVHSCAVDVAGDVWCWGSNTYGQLGRGTAEAIVDLVPARVTWPSP